MGNERPIVLVVEDDVEMNELECELLGIHGFETIPAYTGLQALSTCRQAGPDAVLLDIMLPELDGFETCRRLRAEFNGRLPIVIVSALDEEESRRHGFASGGDAYFSKPFDPDEVVGTLRRLLQLRQTA
jgi:DNA-binding response OmpR family regulator